MPKKLNLHEFSEDVQKRVLSGEITFRDACAEEGHNNEEVRRKTISQLRYIWKQTSIAGKVEFLSGFFMVNQRCREFHLRARLSVQGCMVTKSIDTHMPWIYRLNLSIMLYICLIFTPKQKVNGKHLRLPITQILETNQILMRYTGQKEHINGFWQ